MDFGAWFQELRRRRVIRALFAWGVFSFAALQIIDPLLRAFSMPEWSLQVAVAVLATGFPITAGLAWAFDLTSRGIERTAGPPATPAAALRVSGPFPPIALIVIGALLGAGLAALASWQLTRRSKVREAKDRITIAVADIANETTDRDLDGLSGLLISSLEQSRRLHVLTRSRMTDVLRQLGKDASQRIDEPLARDVGRSSGVRALVLASVRQFDDVYALELRVFDPRTDEYLFTLKEQAKGKRSIPALIDRLAERTRSGFQDTGSSLDATGAGAARIVAGNLEAYGHYFDALRLEDQYLFEAAQAELRAAIRADSTFALAHLKLAAMPFPLQPAREHTNHIRAALEHAERLPEPERLALDAESELLYGRPDHAAAQLERALELRPDDKRLLLRLAQVRARDGFDKARPIAERVLQLDESFAPAQDFVAVTFAWTGDADGCETWAVERTRRWPSALAYGILNGCRLWAGDLSGALAAARKVAEFGGANDRGILARTLLVMQDFDAAEAEMRRQWDRKIYPHGTGWGLAEVLRYRGRRKEAYRVLDELDRRSAPVEARLFRVAYAAGDRDPGRLRNIAREAAADLPVSALALSLALGGEGNEAQRLLQEYPVDPIWLYGAHQRPVAEAVAAAIRSRAAGNAGEARQILEGARSRVLFKDLRILDFFIGETCHIAGDDHCAVKALSDGHRFIWGFIPGAVAYPRSLYLLARSQERLGRTEEARTAIGKLVALWKDADPDLPLATEAMELCRKLECRSRK